jgi:hypothetical protein
MFSNAFDNFLGFDGTFCVDIDHRAQSDRAVKLLQQLCGNRLHRMGGMMASCCCTFSKASRRLLRCAMAVDFELSSLERSKALALMLILRTEVCFQDDLRATRRNRPQHIHRGATQQTREFGGRTNGVGKLISQRLKEGLLENVLREERKAQHLRECSSDCAFAARRRAADNNDGALCRFRHGAHLLYFSVSSAPLPLSGMVASIAWRCAL